MKRNLGIAMTVAALALIVPAMATGVPPRDTNPETKVQLFGHIAEDSLDPQNPSNEVVHFNTVDGTPVGVFRDTHGMLVEEFDNQLEFKYYMANRTCGAGSPRVMLFLDNDENGKFSQQSGDVILHGHVQPPHTCANNEWVYEDLTDQANRWEGPTLPAFPLGTWQQVETAFGGVPVLFAMLIEDSQAFAATNRGDAYYDLISLGNFTVEDHADTGRNCSPNCTDPVPEE